MKNKEHEKRFFLRNKITGLFFCKIGDAVAFSAEDPNEAELLDVATITDIELVWEMTHVQVVRAPVRVLIETTPGRYLHQSRRRQTESPDFSLAYGTISGAKKALGKYRKIWPSAGIALVDGNFNPINADKTL